MEFAEAVVIISEIADHNGTLPLDTLMYMADSLETYTREQRIAYRVFMTAGQEMFKQPALVDA
jgi:hypothetical protein